MRYMLTAQAAALPLALAEAGGPHVMRVLEPGTALCENVHRPQRPVFLRHLCPAEAEVPLTGEETDVAALREAFAPMLAYMDAGKGSFSVQTRIIEGYQPAYKRFDINTALAGAAQAAGLTLDVKTPEQIVSVTLSDGAGWIGISTPEANLSDWTGGMRRFKREAGQISRAEFKLLEALETFRLHPQDGEYAVDLGAAPGGWTRVLRQRGLYVTAVDPAALDPRLMRDKRVTPYRGTAQAYFRTNPQPCDWLVNDMKMESAQSAELMAEGATILKPNAHAVLTLKLPEAVDEWKPRVEAAQALLQPIYEIIGLRQLFHNRNEVTAVLRQA